MLLRLASTQIFALIILCIFVAIAAVTDYVVGILAAICRAMLTAESKMVSDEFLL